MRGLVFSTVIFLFCCSCSAAESNPKRESYDLVVGTVTLRVELALDDQQRQMGLMYRTEMADDEGMLFVFDQDQYLNFWMKNTRLPLSIAYITTNGEIREIHVMQPFSLQSVPSNRAVRYALELNQGAFGRLGISIGDIAQIEQLLSTINR